MHNQNQPRFEDTPYRHLIHLYKMCRGKKTGRVMIDLNCIQYTKVHFKIYCKNIQLIDRYYNYQHIFSRDFNSVIFVL